MIVQNGVALGSSSGGGSDAFAFGGGLTRFGHFGPNVGALFSPPARTLDIGAGALGGNYTPGVSGPLTVLDTLEFVIRPPANLPTTPGTDLYLGLVDAVCSGIGFTSLSLAVYEQGAPILSFATSSNAEANHFFTDDLIDVGQWNAGVTGDLDLKFVLSETFQNDEYGYGVDFQLGISPVPKSGSLSLLGVGALGIFWARRRYTERDRQ